jgi:hypothetical protein
VGTCTSEIVHPVVSVYLMKWGVARTRVEDVERKRGSHFRSTSVDPMFPNLMIPISINHRIPRVGGIKHLSRVENE